MTIPNSFQVKYKNNVETVLQLQNDPLEGAVITTDDASADKIKIKDFVDNGTPKEAEERHGRTEWEDTNYDGLWLAKPNELYDAGLIDDADQLGTVISLSGTASTRGAGTIARARVQRTMEGFFGATISGRDGTVVTPFPASQVIPVTTGGASGAQRMNTKKLREANKMLGEGYVDKMLPKYMVLTEDDNDALLGEVDVTSSDFKGSFGGVVEDGYVRRLLGWNFIHIELDNPRLGPVPSLATDVSGYRKNPFWVKGGFVRNYWRRLRSHVGLVPELRFSEGWFVGTTLAATRTQPAMSGVILNLKG